MAWFKVDDGFHHSAKVLSIPRSIRAESLGAWIIAGTWAADNMTDGYIPNAVLADWPISDDAIGALVEAGLWLLVNGGVVFHDWCEYQPTREQLSAKREETHAKKVAAGKKGAEARWQNNSKPIAEDSRAIASDSPEPEPEPIKEHSYSEAVRDMTYPEDFETFWKSYPRKQAKGDALKAWNSLKKTRPDISVLVAACREYEKTVVDPQFLKMPGPWLRGRRWEDLPVMLTPSVTVRRVETLEEKDARVELEQLEREQARIKRMGANND